MVKDEKERITSLETSIQYMNDSIKELKTSFTAGLNQIRSEISNLRKEVADSAKSYVTLEDLLAREKAWDEKIAEIKQIATTRLWQSVGTTLILTAAVTFLLQYFLSHVGK